MLLWADQADQQIIGLVSLVTITMMGVTWFWILAIKRETTSAMAWCLTVLFLPVLGIALFYFFGYQNIHRPLTRKRRHAMSYRKRAMTSDTFPIVSAEAPVKGWQGIAELAHKLGADQPTAHNRVHLYYEVADAYEAMLEAIHMAKNHIHFEMFIFRSDPSGQRFIAALAERAKQGVKVRFLYDAVGCWNLRRKTLEPLLNVGGEVSAFLPLALLRRKLQINLRNHRKMLIVDGEVAFTGGANIGDEYLGKSRFFGPWRDTFMRVEGPAIVPLQRLFLEDWDFSTGSEAQGTGLFPLPKTNGDQSVQVIWSGPDQDVKVIREVYFAAIMRARQRIWIATPYFVPDVGLMDALELAARSGVDVRIVMPLRPDKWIPLFAARFYWPDLFQAGIQIYQYMNGFYHTKMLLIDDAWASVGTTNFDNRSLFLNFELTCILESKQMIEEVEASFLKDMGQCIRVNPEEFQHRPFIGRLAENACRLLSPIL